MERRDDKEHRRGGKDYGTDGITTTPFTYTP
jgi:hypothetical protein